MKKVRTIPSIIGVAVLLFGLIAGVYLSGRVNFFSSKASSDCTPNNPQITNLTHNSFDISFVTDTDCFAQVVADGRNIFDIRQNQSKTTRKTHYFRVSNLKPEQSYNFSITSGGQNFDFTSYQVKTSKTPNGQLPSSNLAWGRVLEADNTPGQDAIIYLNVPGASPLSAFVGNDGRWNISLAFSLSADKQSWFKPEPDLPEEIIVMSGSSPPTIVNSSTGRNDPVPDIILGKSQDISPLPSLSLTSTPVTPSVSLTPTVSQGELAIDNPKEGESITAILPDFFGRSLAGSTVELSLSPAAGTAGRTTASATGSWHWSPSQALAPGPYTLRAASLGETISRQFQVISSDYGLAFTASSSATTATPTINQTPTLASPTTALTATPTTAVKKTLPSTSSGVPTTGNSSPTIVIIILALSALWLSFRLFRP